jgi:hypothetical protein
MSSVARFHGETGELPKALLVSMKVWNILGRPRQFMGMCVICDSKLKGESVYCTTEALKQKRTKKQKILTIVALAIFSDCDCIRSLPVAFQELVDLFTDERPRFAIHVADGNRPRVIADRFHRDDAF